MILPLAPLYEDARVIPLLPKEGSGVVEREADARTHHPLAPSSAEEGNSFHGGGEVGVHPSKDGKRRANKKRC